VDNGQSIDIVGSTFQGLSFTDLDTDLSTPGQLTPDEVSTYLSPADFAAADLNLDGGLDFMEVRAVLDRLRNGGDGITENDGMRNSATGNDGIEFPVIASAEVNGTMLELEFERLDPALDHIEIYHSLADGNGEGETFLVAIPASDLVFNGTTFVTSIDTSSISVFDDSRFITAIAIDNAGNTSEFGQ